MNIDVQQALSSEMSELESILAELPAERVIEKLSFQARLDSAREQLAHLPTMPAVKKANQIEIVEEIHLRAVKKVAEFLKQVSDEQASCGFEFKKESFKFASPEQVTRSSQRLQEQNIRESKETFFGSFQGVLPSSRQFEFKSSREGSILRGKIGSDFQDADRLNREYLNKKVQVILQVIQVGEARPRYVLERLDDVILDKS